MQHITQRYWYKLMITYNKMMFFRYLCLTQKYSALIEAIGLVAGVAH